VWVLAPAAQVLRLVLVRAPLAWGLRRATAVAQWIALAAADIATSFWVIAHGYVGQLLFARSKLNGP